MLRAVIFDYNGVIIDDEHVHLAMYQKILAEEGMHLSEEDYAARYLAYDDAGAFTRMFEDQGRKLDEAALASLIAHKARDYQEYIKDHLVIFPGAVELVQQVKKAFPLALCSGALGNEIRFGLASAGIADCFQIIISAEDVSQSKPDPEGYLLALKQLNETPGKETRIAASECVVIEDSTGGLEAAKRAGMKVAAVTHSFSAEILCNADLVVDALVDLNPARLQQLWE